MDFANQIRIRGFHRHTSTGSVCWTKLNVLWSSAELSVCLTGGRLSPMCALFMDVPCILSPPPQIATGVVVPWTWKHLRPMVNSVSIGNLRATDKEWPQCVSV